jgi:hypothetical protein
MTAEEIPEAQPGQVTFALAWRAEGQRLDGDLEAVNVCDHTVRLSGKPWLRPLGVDGELLDTDSVVTAEMREPGYVELAPGESAKANVGWAGWAGPPASDHVIVEWQAGRADVAATGPRQPKSQGPATNLWTSWFERMQ